MSDLKKIIKTIKISSGDNTAVTRKLAKVIQEVSLAVLVDGKPLANIACAGIHLEELATGFLRSERIIARSGDIEEIKMNKKKHLVDVILKKKTECSPASVKNIASSGARGKSNMDLLTLLSPATDFKIKTRVALNLMEELLNNSEVHNQTGGTHCSALAMGKKIVALREDIGRHNTIDMLGGYALMQKINLHQAIILTTGRISSEIVYKVWNMGIPVIISHSAPTATAVALSRNANILLIGYVRHGRMNIYSHERRVII
ncbi:MAG: formate dehydrogenase accessory sulfurtransferase FdhD [Smithella sp.]